MKSINDLSKDELLELISAYDKRMEGTGSVSVKAFYKSEAERELNELYEADLYDEARPVVEPEPLVFSVGSVKLHIHGNVELFCEFENDPALHPLRSRIQDIQAGDAFVVGAKFYCASSNAEQDIKKADCPWVVRTPGKLPGYTLIFNESDVKDARRLIFSDKGVQEAQRRRGLDNLISNAASRVDNPPDKSVPNSPER